HEVELVVRDSGVGFASTEGTRLFQKFTRLRSGAGYFGTGLGLYIVRRLMELAHGRVSAHSDGVGQGASVHLTGPAAPAGAGRQPAAGQEMRPWVPPRPRRCWWARVVRNSPPVSWGICAPRGTRVCAPRATR